MTHFTPHIMAEALRILTCDDNPGDSGLLAAILHPTHISCVCTELPEIDAAVSYHTIVVDDDLGRGNPTAGLEFLEAHHRHHEASGLPHPVRLLVSGTITPEIARRAAAIDAVPLPKAAVGDAVSNEALANAIRELIHVGLAAVTRPEHLMPYLDIDSMSEPMSHTPSSGAGYGQHPTRSW